MKKGLMKKGLFLGLALVIALTAFMPASAYADEKDKDKDRDRDKLIPVSCTITLAVTDPGTFSFKKDIVETTGEKTSGYLDCNLAALDGEFNTVHSSRIKVDSLTGSFKGHLTGTFTLKNNDGKISNGKMTANISGAIIGVAPSPPFPPGTFIHRVTDDGRWDMDGDIDVKGTFAITLTGIVGLPASMGGLRGGGTMQGMAKKD